MAKIEDVKTQLQSLLDDANTKTAVKDASLTKAIKRLIAGYFATKISHAKNCYAGYKAVLNLPMPQQLEFENNSNGIVVCSTHNDSGIVLEALGDGSFPFAKKDFENYIDFQCGNYGSARVVNKYLYGLRLSEDNQYLTSDYKSSFPVFVSDLQGDYFILYCTYNADVSNSSGAMITVSSW